MRIFPSMEQGSDQWFKIRTGRPTASNFSRIITPTGKDSSQWEGYAIDLMADCIRPDMVDFIGNRHTDRGNELEPAARDTFAEIMDLNVQQVGFITRDDGIVGCSPDGLIYQGRTLVAGLELKCPLAKNHAKYLIQGELPAEYAPQVHGGMAVTGLDYWYFMSYCEGMRPFILRVERDGFTTKVGDALDRFLIYYAEKRKQVMPLLVEGGLL
jgi:hypothetical protein